MYLYLVARGAEKNQSSICATDGNKFSFFFIKELTFPFQQNNNNNNNNTNSSSNNNNNNCIDVLMLHFVLTCLITGCSVYF